MVYNMKHLIFLNISVLILIILGYLQQYLLGIIFLVIAFYMSFKYLWNS
jgi:hypothetical protein